MAEPFNPLDKNNLGQSVVTALLALTAIPLTDLAPFEGAGIYAIYYRGDFPAYAALAADISSRRRPIYVGKAVPSGARRGASLTTTAIGSWLFRRLCEHRDSIAAVRNLEVSHFFVRYLAVDDIWIPLGESLLISMYQPVWNSLLDGFGNHDPGSGRYNGLRPLWDVLHPGRSWADKCRERTDTIEDISRRVMEHLDRLID